MRQVYENRDEATERGRTAAKYVRREFTWPQIAVRYAERIPALTQVESKEA